MKRSSNKWGSSLVTAPENAIGIEEEILDGSSGHEGESGSSTKPRKRRKLKRKESARRGTGKKTARRGTGKKSDSSYSPNNTTSPGRRSGAQPRDRSVSPEGVTDGAHVPSLPTDRSRDRSSPRNNSARPVILKEGVAKLRFKSNRGYIERSSDSTAVVHVDYRARTATKCPCPDKSCTGLVKLGRYGESGDGSAVCLHCGMSGKDGSFFKCRATLHRHVRGGTCTSQQSVDPEKSAVDALGEHLCNEISNPVHVKHIRRSGKVTKVFLCPKCGERPLWMERFQHAHVCYPQHGVQISGNISPQVSDDDDMDSDSDESEEEDY